MTHERALCLQLLFLLALCVAGWYVVPDGARVSGAEIVREGRR